MEDVFTSVSYLAPPFQAKKALAALGGFFAYGVGLSALYATTGIGLPCPFRAVTGWDCPLCGGTRLGRSLLEGDVVGAFLVNPVVLVGLVILGVLGVAWTVEVAGGPRMRPPADVAERWRRVHPTRWLAIGLVAAVIYTLMRNLL